MAALSASSKVSSILANAKTSVSKKMSEIGEVMREKTGTMTNQINTKTAQMNVAKWGLTAATTGAGVGVGVYATSVGLGSALEKVSNSTSNAMKSFGGVIIVVLLIIVAFVAIRKWSEKHD